MSSWPLRSPRPEDLDPGVARALAARDEAAWEYFRAGYDRLIRHWCRRAAVPPQDVDDLLQMAYERVLKRGGRFQPNHDTGCFRGWLRKLVRHALADYFRIVRKEPAPTLANAAAILFPLHDEDEQDACMWLWDQLEAELDENDLRILCRSALDDYSAAQIAEELGLTVEVVWKRKSRAVALLRERLKNFRDHGEKMSFFVRRFG